MVGSIYIQRCWSWCWRLHWCCYCCNYYVNSILYYSHWPFADDHVYTFAHGFKYLNTLLTATNNNTKNNWTWKIKYWLIFFLSLNKLGCRRKKFHFHDLCLFCFWGCVLAGDRERILDICIEVQFCHKFSSKKMNKCDLRGREEDSWSFFMVNP